MNDPFSKVVLLVEGFWPLSSCSGNSKVQWQKIISVNKVFNFSFVLVMLDLV